jgi:hypothetical protein
VVNSLNKFSTCIEMFIYLIHSIYPLEIIIDKNGKDITNYGQRNAQVVMAGLFFYIVLYLMFSKNFNENTNYITILFLILVFDIILMASVHYYYHGKTLNEVGVSPLYVPFYPFFKQF